MKDLLECERKRISRLEKYQLPHRFRKVGVVIATISFVALLMNKFTLNSDTLRFVIRHGLLIGFLVISISKEEIEDELAFIDIYPVISLGVYYHF